MYTTNMIRTQIYIDEDLHKELLLLAKEQNEPMAKIARDMLRAGVKSRNIDKSGKSNLLAIANMRLNGGDRNLSENIDFYLYGSSEKHE